MGTELLEEGRGAKQTVLLTGQLLVSTDVSRGQHRCQMCPPQGRALSPPMPPPPDQMLALVALAECRCACLLLPPCSPALLGGDFCLQLHQFTTFACSAGTGCSLHGWQMTQEHTKYWKSQMQCLLPRLGSAATNTQVPSLGCNQIMSSINS